MKGWCPECGCSTSLIHLDGRGSVAVCDDPDCAYEVHDEW